MISPTVTCHFGGQAHNTAVELERAKPNNEKAVTKKALPPTVNQPKIDHVCDKNMSEGYIKLFCTAYTLHNRTNIATESVYNISQNAKRK